MVNCGVLLMIESFYLQQCRQGPLLPHAWPMLDFFLVHIAIAGIGLKDDVETDQESPRVLALEDGVSDLDVPHVCKLDVKLPLERCYIISTVMQNLGGDASQQNAQPRFLPEQSWAL
jgi:hypothetical protein